MRSTSFFSAQSERMILSMSDLEIRRESAIFEMFLSQAIGSWKVVPNSWASKG